MIIRVIDFMLFIALFGEEYCKSEKIETSFSFQSADSHVFVFDDLIKPAVATSLVHYLVNNGGFSYYYPDPNEEGKRNGNEGNLHWKAPIPPNLLIKMRIWASVRKAYLSLPEEIIQGKRYLPFEASGIMLRRGDFTIPFEAADDGTNRIFVRIFLAKQMYKNYYSDQAFYDKNDEIFASIHPRYTRIIIWTGNVSTLFRPPSMGNEQAEYSLLLKLSTNKELFEKACNDYLEHQQYVEEHKKKPFPFSNHINKYDFEHLNLSQHLIGRYNDKDGNVVAFFDNLIPEELSLELRTYLVNYEKGFMYQPYDPDSSEGHDNVNWIMQFKVEKLLNTPYWTLIQKLSAFLSNKTEWYPYDVSCNLIQHTHHTRIHLDCVNKEFEYTFLLYLNPKWDENMYAETSFYEYGYNRIEKEGDSVAEADEEYNFIAAAVPKFGRIAIFRNLIPHSARPPAPNFFAARYTFPVKVSESFQQARAKLLREALDYKREDMTEDPWYEPLRQGQYAPYLEDDRREWIEKQILIMEEAKMLTHKELLDGSKKVLIPEKFRTGK